MIILKLIIIFALEKEMRFLALFILLIVNQGCENITNNNKNTYEENSTYICSKCGSSLYNENELFHENDSSKDFINSIEKKVKVFDTLYGKSYDSESNKSKSELFCTKCDNKLGNLISDDKGQRHCIDKNAIILKKLIK